MYISVGLKLNIVVRVIIVQYLTNCTTRVNLPRFLRLLTGRLRNCRLIVQRDFLGAGVIDYYLYYYFAHLYITLYIWKTLPY